MRGALLVAMALVVAGCDPFVVEVDAPSVCTVVPSQRFVPVSGGLAATLPLDLALDQVPGFDGVSATVQLISVTLTAADGSDLRKVTGAQVRAFPARQVSSTVAGIVAASSSPPILEDGALTIPGTEADIFPQLADGPAQLAIQLDVPAGQALTASVGVCVRVNASAHYLK